MTRTLLLSLTLAALAIGTSVAQTPAAPEHNHGQGQEAAAAPSCCSGHQTPGATGAQHDAALRELIAKMNEASGEEKVALMADAITALANAPHRCPMMEHESH